MMILFLISSFLITGVISSVIPIGVTIGIHPQSQAIQSLYHAQDVLGQYSYGYATPTSTKSETKTADGVTRGGYSYIDTNGYLQTVEYVSDPVHGFRVAASNLPQDLPDVAYARARHLADFQAIKAEREQIAAQRIVQYSNPIAVPISAVPHVPLVALPQPVQDLPEVVKARNEHLAALHLATITAGRVPQPVHDLPEVARARAEHLAAVEAVKLRDATWNSGVALSPIPNQLSSAVIPVQTSSVSANTIVSVAPAAPVAAYTPAYAPSAQYSTGDGLGLYSYGYIGPHSAKTETRTADGVTRGGYSYIDGNGLLQTVNYVADDHGFRVAATNLPSPPPQQPVPIVSASVPVVHAKGQVISGGAVVAPATHELYKTEIVY